MISELPTRFRGVAVCRQVSCLEDWHDSLLLNDDLLTSSGGWSEHSRIRTRDKAQRTTLLRTWASHSVRPGDEAARNYREQLVRFQCELAADLHNRTTPEQRTHAAERLQDWARDLRSAAAAMAAAR